MPVVYVYLCLMNNETPSLPVTNPETQPTVDGSNHDFKRSTPTPEHTAPRKNKKPLLFLIGLALIIAGGIIFYLVTNKETSPKPATSASHTFASAKPQFAQSDSVAGYVTFNAAKFKEVSTIGLPPVESSNPNVNTVIVAANVVGYGDSGLYLYDLSTNKTYKLTSGGGDPRIMSDHFVVYGFDEGNGSNHKLGARLLDLKTGEDKIIFSASPENAPGTVCCSVSPDGFTLALPQKNKLTVWDIRSAASKDYSAHLNPVADGSNAGAAGVEMSYATPVWAGNESIIYADKPATETVMIDGVATKPAVDTSLFLMNLSDGKSTELTTGKSGIYDIYTRENGGVIFTHETTVGGGVIQFTQQSLDDKPTVLTTTGGAFASLSPAGDKLYVFPLSYNPNSYYVVDTNTKVSSSFNPLPSTITKASQIIPKGWAGEDKIILEILDTAGVSNHEYIAIYNTTTDKVEQYSSIK